MALSTAAREPALERLLVAILKDDRITAAALVKNEPRLAAALVATARLYESEILHWIYVNDSALHLAAAGYRVEIALMLLAAGADPNSARNHRNGRPLHYAADGHPPRPSFDGARQVAMIRCLLKAGAQINAADKNGATALHRAVRTRAADAVEALLQAGADPTARNDPGATPFHLAVQNTGRGGSGAPESKEAQSRIIKSMLSTGLSPEIKDAQGRSVLDWAKSDWVRDLLVAPPPIVDRPVKRQTRRRS